VRNRLTKTGQQCETAVHELLEQCDFKCVGGE